jgi:hypothetical protein
MSDDPTPEEFADPANWHPIEEHPYLNDPPKMTVADTPRDRIAPDDLCKCGHRAHRHDNFGLSRCCHYRQCGCFQFDLAVRWRGDE